MDDATRERAVAAVYEGPETISVQEFPLPEVGPTGMLVDVTVAGIDGSDIKFLHGENDTINDLAPVIMGDEIVGEVVRIGEEAAERRGLSVGDRVVVEAKLPCMNCEFCVRGNYYTCEKGWRGHTYGWIGCEEPPHLWGSYASHVFVPDRARVYEVPENLPPRSALVGASVLANGYRWTESAGVSLGDDVAVLGPGPQGLGCTLLAELRGATVVTVGLERDRERLRKAEEFGAADTVVTEDDQSAPEVSRSIVDAFGGREPDVVIEAAGAQSAFDIAVELVRPQGRIAHVSLAGNERIAVDLDELLLKEVEVQNLLSHPHTVAPALKLASDLEEGPIDLASLVSHSFPVEEAETALRTAGYERDARPLKVVLEPEAPW
jgi:alcohol dehydrogenase